MSRSYDAYTEDRAIDPATMTPGDLLKELARNVEKREIHDAEIEKLLVRAEQIQEALLPVFAEGQAVSTMPRAYGDTVLEVTRRGNILDVCTITLTSIDDLAWPARETLPLAPGEAATDVPVSTQTIDAESA